MTWTIRPASAAELSAVLDLWRAADAEVTTTDDLTAIAALHARDPEALLVADREGVLEGTIVAGWDGWRGQLYRLAVVPPARRRGLGAALVRAAESRLAGLGARRVAAIVVDDHANALAFWEAVGYERAPHARFTRTLQPGR